MPQIALIHVFEQPVC